MSQELDRHQFVPPLWREDLDLFYRGRISRQFILHFNINDYIIDLSNGAIKTTGGIPTVVP